MKTSFMRERPNRNIAKAKRLFKEGHTFVAVRGGVTYVSDKKGILPIMDLLAEGKELKGFSVADKVVGKAAAMVFAYCGIKEVFAQNLGSRGHRVLEEFKIASSFSNYTGFIVNRDYTDDCPIEKVVHNITKPDVAYRALVEWLKNPHVEPEESFDDYDDCDEHDGCDGCCDECDERDECCKERCDECEERDECEYKTENRKFKT